MIGQLSSILGTIRIQTMNRWRSGGSARSWIAAWSHSETQWGNLSSGEARVFQCQMFPAVRAAKNRSRGNVMLVVGYALKWLPLEFMKGSLACSSIQA